VTIVKAEESKIILTFKKHKVNLLINTAANISAIPFSSRPTSSKKITVSGISDQPLQHYFTQPLACSWQDFHFCHSFLIVPETPTPLLGGDLLSKLGVQLLLPLGEYFCLPLIEEQVYPVVWINGQYCGMGTNNSPSPNSSQEPLLGTLKPEVKKGLIPIIKD
jgi:hypothetical protein